MKFPEEICDWFAGIIFWLPGRIGQAVRYIWCRMTFGGFGSGSRAGRHCTFLSSGALDVGDGTSIGPGCFFTASGGGGIRIGNSVSFNERVHLNASVGGRIAIGDNCLFGPGVVVRTANHRFNDPETPIRFQGHDSADIVLNDDCWIAANVVILPGAVIGRGAVVGAGAVVTGELEPMSINVGNPARKIAVRGKGK